MQLKQLNIEGLFGHLHHSIQFPLPVGGETTPSLVILYGRNGVGKTTLLRMLNGLLRLDFNPFRRVPVEHCELMFDSGDCLSVKPLRKRGRLLSLEVSYLDMSVSLHPDHPGALKDEGVPKVEAFRQAFFTRTEDIAFEFIDTERLYQLQPTDPLDDMSRLSPERESRALLLRHGARNPKARLPEEPQSLTARVRRFVQEAQVNYRAFFATTEPDLFSRILERLTSGEAPNYRTADLRDRLKKIHSQDTSTGRFGLEPDRWDFSQMMEQLDHLTRRKGTKRQQALTVLGSYVELLESRASERALVADRLLSFEKQMADFFADKAVTIDPRLGIRIQTKEGAQLEERQLSSGEFHLLFLMIAALVTRRRGTVIAIDEPEMSMHIAWQRKLIPALLECASKAEPLFIFSTHSPDLAASYPDAMVELR